MGLPVRIQAGGRDDDEATTTGAEGPGVRIGGLPVRIPGDRGGERGVRIPGGRGGEGLTTSARRPALVM